MGKCALCAALRWRATRACCVRVRAAVARASVCAARAPPVCAVRCALLCALFVQLGGAGLAGRAARWAAAIRSAALMSRLAACCALLRLSQSERLSSCAAASSSRADASAFFIALAERCSEASSLVCDRNFSSNSCRSSTSALALLAAAWMSEPYSVVCASVLTRVRNMLPLC